MLRIVFNNLNVRGLIREHELDSTDLSRCRLEYGGNQVEIELLKHNYTQSIVFIIRYVVCKTMFEVQDNS